MSYFSFLNPSKNHINTPKLLKHLLPIINKRSINYYLKLYKLLYNKELTLLPL